MRYKEFVTPESLALIKFTFEKALHSLIKTHRKQAKIIKNKKRIARKQEKTNRTKAFKNKPDSTYTINSRPKRL